MRNSILNPITEGSGFEITEDDHEEAVGTENYFGAFSTYIDEQLD